MSGNEDVDQTGVYGTLGVGSTANIPGARSDAISWTDNSGNLWLFGGKGNDINGIHVRTLNDLWKYNPINGEWTWMAGSKFEEQNGIYGILGIGSTNNIPSARKGAVSSTDKSRNFWLFGGAGYKLYGSYGLLNDLWRYDPSSGEWTWMAGSDIRGQAGSYGYKQLI